MGVYTASTIAQGNSVNWGTGAISDGPDLAKLAAEAVALLRADASVGKAHLEQTFESLSAADRETLAELVVRNLPNDVAQSLAAETDGLAALQRIQAELGPSARLSEAHLRAFNETVAAGQAQATDVDRSEVLLDLGQIALALVGIVEPTPFADGSNAIISLFRGDFWGALLDGASIIPYIGDLAKAGKLPRFLSTIEKAVDLAKVDAAFARVARPVLEQIAKAIDALPLDRLPNSAQDIIGRMRTKLDEFLQPAGRNAFPNARTIELDGNGLFRGLDNAGPNAPNFQKWIDGGGVVRYDEATDTFIYGRTIETSNGGRQFVEVPYAKGPPDGAARPDFSEYSEARVEIDNMTGRTEMEIRPEPGDFSKAWQGLEDQLVNGGMTRDQARAYIEATYGVKPRTRGPMQGHYPDASPDGYTWHHHQDGQTMQLVDRQVHATFTHSGGASLSR